MDATRLSTYDPTWDTEVLRNVAVQRTAEGLKEIDRLYRAQRYDDAWQLAYRLEQDQRAVAKLTGDQQMVKDADTMRTYEDTLAKWVQQQTGQLPRPADERSTQQPVHGREQVLPRGTTVLEVK